MLLLELLLNEKLNLSHHQNSPRILRSKTKKKIPGRGHCSLPEPSPSGGGWPSPHLTPIGAFVASIRPLRKNWQIQHCCTLASLRNGGALEQRTWTFRNLPWSIAHLFVPSVSLTFSHVFIRDAGYMRTCDRIGLYDRIFCENPHIAYFSAHNCFFKIAYAEIMPHMRHICRLVCIFAAYFSAYFAKFRTFSRIFCIKTARIF